MNTIILGLTTYYMSNKKKRITYIILHITKFMYAPEEWILIILGNFTIFNFVLITFFLLLKIPTYISTYHMPLYTVDK